MITTTDAKNLLKKIARKAMLEKGLAPEFSISVQTQLETINKPASLSSDGVVDLRHLLWCSIDNDDSLDLDQLSIAEKINDNEFRVMIAVADVDALVTKGTPIDLHAQINTTSVYTSALLFPMLPEKLSTNLTSLNENEDRVAVIFDYTLDSKAELKNSTIYRAAVKNKAKLTYSAVGAWLENKGPLPQKAANIPQLPELLKLQDLIAQSLKQRRHSLGALSLETIEVKPVFENGNVIALAPTLRNRAHELIENFMIGANSVSAKYLAKNKIPSFRRVVKTPERWDRIVEVAANVGEKLPAVPDSKALEEFLVKMHKKDPETYPDLSLTIIKLLGSGEYIIEMPGDAPTGHFGLALRDYTHSTAPNRRYPDIVTQRLLKASLRGEEKPYKNSELENLAAKCTEKEDAASKVERQVRKSAAAILLSARIGETFDGLVTGASEKGTWVRLIEPPVEGKLLINTPVVDVGDRVRVKLVSVDVMKGFIDFALIKK